MVENPSLSLPPIMLLSNPKNGSSNNSSATATAELSQYSPPRFSEDNIIDSTCSTPFVSAPSSPSHGPPGYFFSAPASPMHFILSNQKNIQMSKYHSSESGTFEFEFSSRFSLEDGSGGKGSMTSADELFFNGKIRPVKLYSHLQKPQEIEDVVDQGSRRGRDLTTRGTTKNSHRKARSMSPLRIAQYQRNGSGSEAVDPNPKQNHENNTKENESETTPSCSASSSRSSSSSGRNSKKWTFLKDLLHRSKSESSASNAKKSPSPVLSPSSSRDEKKGVNDTEAQKLKTEKYVPAGKSRKPANGGVWKRRVPASAHELHYTANRAQAEEMKKKTYLPYRQGLLGCLGFSSKSYGAFSGLTGNFNPLSSR